MVCILQKLNRCISSCLIEISIIMYFCLPIILQNLRVCFQGDFLKGFFSLLSTCDFLKGFFSFLAVWQPSIILVHYLRQLIGFMTSNSTMSSKFSLKCDCYIDYLPTVSQSLGIQNSELSSLFFSLDRNISIYALTCYIGLF